MAYLGFEYTGRKLKISPKNCDWDIEIIRGDLIAYRSTTKFNYVYLNEDEDPNFRYSLTKGDLKLLLRSTKPTTRMKVKGKVVQPIKPNRTATPSHGEGDAYRLTIDSSNLKAAWYIKETKTLHVVFHNDDHWAYEDVSMSMVRALENHESQGSYFYHKIRNVKPQYKVAD